jgi:hypothetical protein
MSITISASDGYCEPLNIEMSWKEDNLDVQFFGNNYSSDDVCRALEAGFSLAAEVKAMMD